MNVRFVLVRPRNPNNIAAAARALANFGFDELLVVDPYPPVWKETRAAMGAQDVLAQTRAVSLKEALADCHLVLGTTALKTRRARQPVLPLPGVSDFLQERLPRYGRLAVLFGPEKTGLSAGELGHCHALLRVPTTPKQPSMNLAQAVVVTAYELSRAPSSPAPTGGEPPTAEQIDDLVNKAAAACRALSYRQGRPLEELRRMFLRWRLLKRDAALLQGLFGRIAS